MASSKRKVTKSKGKASNNSARGSPSKKRTTKARDTKKTNRRRPTAATMTRERSNEAPKIKDSGAVKEARSSIEDIVEDAQKTVKETIEPSS